MNQFAPKGTPPFALVLGAVIGLSACAKKEPRPLRTEPWLAHPAPRASAVSDPDAALPVTRYALTEQSLIRFEVPGSHGPLRGTFTRVSGELNVVLSDLSQSHGQVRADLGSLAFEGPGSTEAAARAGVALELADGGTAPNATFDLSELSEASPGQVEPAPESAAASPFTRRARGTAVGNLLLHGFRVVRRAPVEAEFGFLGDRSTPSGLTIRSRAPFVVSLQVHAIRAPRPEGDRKPKSTALALVDEVLVSIELYGIKIE